MGRRFRAAAPPTLKFEAVEELAQRLDVPVADLLALIRIEPRTALRRRAEGTLNADEADRLLRVARVALRAREVLGSMDKARAWLKRSNRVLGGVTPLSCLGTDLGTESVTDELGRIDVGDLQPSECATTGWSIPKNGASRSSSSPPRGATSTSSA